MIRCGALMRVFIFVAFALCAALWSPHQAWADDVADEAELQFTLGNERFNAGDYRGALTHYLASNRLVPNRNVVFNIAATYRQLHDFPNAYRYYSKLLEGESDPKALANIQGLLNHITPNVAVLRVETDPPGAKVFLERKDLGERGTSPQRLGLAPGKYKVMVERAGYEDAEAVVEVKLGIETPVTLTLERILGSVRVEGEATGATIRADSEDSPALGTVPATIQLPPGPHQLFIAKPGFATYTVLVTVAARKVVSVRPSPSAQLGTLVVNADERDATVEVDGKAQGFAPTVLNLPVGRHAIRVSLKGFKPVERLVNITPTDQPRLDIRFVPEEEVEAASRITESVDDAPASVTIIPSSELRGLAYPRVWEALRGVRGVYLGDDGAYPVVGFRGFSRPGDYGNRVLVLLDGQPMNDNWVWTSYTSYDVRTDLEDIDRIEVVRGPGSVLYGAGAFSGVINLVTRRQGTSVGEVGVSAVGDGMGRARARANISWGKDAGMWTSIAAGKSQGRDFFFPEYVNDGPPTVAGHARGLDGLASATWSGRAWWKALTLQWSYNTQTKQLATGQFETIVGDSRTRQTDGRFMVEARFEPTISENVRSLTRAHYNYVIYRADFATLPDQGGLQRQTFDGAWVGVEQRFMFTPWRALRLTAGGEVDFHLQARQFNAVEANVSPTFLSDEAFRITAGYAVADIAPTSSFKLTGGARLDAYSYARSSFQSINPRLAAIVKPYEGGNLKVMAGKAFRAPSQFELFFVAPTGQVRNENLQPENAYTGEVEYSHRFSPTVVGLATAYANYITNLIAQRIVPGTTDYQYENTDTPVGTLGAEVELRREWKEGWMAGLSYSVQRSQYLKSTAMSDLLTFEKNNTLREVPNSPPHLASFKGAMPILSRALSAMTRISFVSGRYDRNDTLDAPAPQLKTEPAAIWDLVLTGTEPRFGVRYALGVYNLLGWRDVAPVSPEFRQTVLAQAGRTFLASIQANF